MRTAEDDNYALSRTPENRIIYAQQQIAWIYTDLLKAQRWYHLSHGVRGASALRKAERDLAEAHERHLKACAELGPAKVATRRVREYYEYELRDAAGFIRALAGGHATRMNAARMASLVALELGLEVA